MALTRINNQALTNVTSAGLPSGSVVQVVQGTIPTSTASTTSSSFQDATGFTATITPQSSNNKIMVLFTARLNNSAGSNKSARGTARILRGSTEVARRFAGHYIGDASPVDRNAYDMISISILDSPATTSSTTYKVQLLSDASTNTISLSGSSNQESSFVLMEIAG